MTVFGDIIYNLKDKSVRMERASYFGYPPLILQSEFQAEKIIKEVTLLFAGFVFISLGYHLLTEITKKFLTWYEIKKSKLDKTSHVITDKKNPIICKICNKNLKNVFYKPCLHLEICDVCYVSKGITHC